MGGREGLDDDGVGRVRRPWRVICVLGSRRVRPVGVQNRRSGLGSPVWLRELSLRRIWPARAQVSSLLAFLTPIRSCQILSLASEAGRYIDMPLIFLVCSCAARQIVRRVTADLGWATRQTDCALSLPSQGLFSQLRSLLRQPAPVQRSFVTSRMKGTGFLSGPIARSSGVLLPSRRAVQARFICQRPPQTSAPDSDPEPDLTILPLAPLPLPCSSCREPQSFLLPLNMIDAFSYVMLL